MGLYDLVISFFALTTGSSKDRRLESEAEIPKLIPGEYSVPPQLKDDGFYAIVRSTATGYMTAMDYGPPFPNQFILYDRGNKIAIDITCEDRSSRYYSGYNHPVLLSDSDIELIEKYLTGIQKPEYNDSPAGVKSFIAREEDDPKYVPLREKMRLLQQRRQEHKAAEERLLAELRSTVAQRNSLSD